MLYVIYGIVAVTIFTLLQVVFTYFGLIGNIVTTLAVSFIICTPITLLYMIWLEVVMLKEFKLEEMRERRRLLKKEKL